MTNENEKEKDQRPEVVELRVTLPPRKPKSPPKPQERPTP
jgi:hypothetical protein